MIKATCKGEGKTNIDFKMEDEFNDYEVRSIFQANAACIILGLANAYCEEFDPLVSREDILDRWVAKIKKVIEEEVS